MSTEPRPGDIIRVSYETTVQPDGSYVGDGTYNVRNASVEVIGLADDPANDLVGTVRMTEFGPAIRRASKGDDLDYTLIKHSGLSYSANVMRSLVAGGKAPIVGMVPGSPAAEAQENDFANEAVPQKMGSKPHDFRPNNMLRDRCTWCGKPASHATHWISKDAGR